MPMVSLKLIMAGAARTGAPISTYLQHAEVHLRVHAHAATMWGMQTVDEPRPRQWTVVTGVTIGHVRQTALISLRDSKI